MMKFWPNTARRFKLKKTFFADKKISDESLGTTVEDLKGFARMVETLMAQNALCVVGNEKKIADEKELFKKILPLRQ